MSFASSSLHVRTSGAGECNYVVSAPGLRVRLLLLLFIQGIVQFPEGYNLYIIARNYTAHNYWLPFRPHAGTINS